MNWLLLNLLERERVRNRQIVGVEEERGIQVFEQRRFSAFFFDVSPARWRNDSMFTDWNSLAFWALLSFRFVGMALARFPSRLIFQMLRAYLPKGLEDNSTI